MPKRTCTVDGCGRKHRAKDLCASHYAQARYTPEQRHPKVSVSCEYCGAMCEKHPSNTRKHRFCSLACRDQERARQRAARLVPMRVEFGAWCSLPLDHPVHRYAATQQAPRRWWTVIVSGPCSWCGRNFTTGTGTTASFCSDRCAKGSAKGRRGRRFLISPRRRMAIYERDAWTCQLCFESVDPDLMTMNPLNDWAPSLDHIECQAWTLIPDHSDSNLRLAHRWCNAVRGDGRYYDESDLRAAS